jgi:hypothetical protein
LQTTAGGQQVSICFRENISVLILFTIHITNSKMQLPEPFFKKKIFLFRIMFHIKILIANNALLYIRFSATSKQQQFTGDFKFPVRWNSAPHCFQSVISD